MTRHRFFFFFSEKSQNETDPSALPVTNKPPTTAEVVVVPKRRGMAAAERETIVTSLSSPRSTLFSTACFPPRAYGTPVSPVSPPARGGDTRRSTRTSPSSSPTASARKTPRGPRSSRHDVARRTSAYACFFENVSFSFATEDPGSEDPEGPGSANARRHASASDASGSNGHSFATFVRGETTTSGSSGAKAPSALPRTNERHARRSFRSFERRCHHSSPFDE